MRKPIITILLLHFLLTANYSQEKLLNPTEPEIQKITMVGKIVAKKLLSNLQAELLKEIRSSDPVNALAVCNLKAMPLTEEIVSTQDNIISIKRTSNNYRNPLNKPDSLEQIALKYFKQHWNEKRDTHVQKIQGKDGSYYKFYKALEVKGLCVTCHGSEENMSNKIKQKIADLYPSDKAVGYNVGDFRGAVTIEFSE